MAMDECRIMEVASGFAFGYDPTGRSVFYIAIDHLTFIVLKKLTPKFIFINACTPMVYKETEKYFVLFAQN
jgi:hypothetical protein